MIGHPLCTASVGPPIYDFKDPSSQVSLLTHDTFSSTAPHPFPGDPYPFLPMANQFVSLALCHRLPLLPFFTFPFPTYQIHSGSWLCTPRWSLISCAKGRGFRKGRKESKQAFFKQVACHFHTLAQLQLHCCSGS